MTDTPDFGNTSQTVQILELSESLNKLASIKQLSSTESREERDLFIQNVKAILKPLQIYPFTIPRRYGNLLDISVDQEANQVLQLCEDQVMTMKPIEVTRDGNCLFNVFATFLLGKPDAKMSKILRVYSTFELLSNFDVYKHDELCRGYLRYPDGRQADDHEIETKIIKKAKCCAQLREPCGFITLIAIANILRRSIRLVHPIPSNNIKLAHDPNVMNQTINPTVTEPAAERPETIYVLACGNVKGIMSGKEWPSHFVLLVDTNSPAAV